MATAGTSSYMMAGQAPSKTAAGSLSRHRKRKVVVAVGGASDTETNLAWRWLNDLFLDPARDALTFVHCVRKTFPGDYDTKNVLPQPLDATAGEWLPKEAIDTCRKNFPSASFVELPIAVESAANMIIEYARVGHGGIPDVVAVATRQDRGALNKAFMGSTSAAVARNCPAATLLVRSRVGPGSPAAGAEPPTGAALTGPATGAPSKVTEGAALAVTATLAAAAARAAAAEAEKRVALELVAASGGDEQAEKEAAVKTLEATQQEANLEKKMMAQAAAAAVEEEAVSAAAAELERPPHAPQRKIVMCLDGTAGSNLLVDWTLANVVQPGDSVTLAHAEAGADTDQPPLFVENIFDNCVERVAGTVGAGGVARVLWIIPTPKTKQMALSALVENLQANEREVDLVVVGSRRWQPEGRIAGALKSAASSIIPSLGSVSRTLIGALSMSTLLVSNEALVSWEGQEVPLSAAASMAGGGA